MSVGYQKIQRIKLTSQLFKIFTELKEKAGRIIHTNILWNLNFSLKPSTESLK